MQTSLTYRTNRDLFSNHYLDKHLPETEAWEEISDAELAEAKEDIMELWEREKETAPKRNESQLEEKFIRPMFRKLGIPFEVEESTSRTQRRPDYGFFESEDAARNAFQRRENDGDFYKNAVAVADAKRWGRPLDTRGSGEHERDFENPSYQIHVYLQETPARWAILTDGKKWRLYYGPTSHRLDSYYEIDLSTVLENGNLEDFKYFYLFFRLDAFLEDTGGDCFLDNVYHESNIFAQELGEDLQDNIYQAIKILSEGYLQYPENNLDEDDLELIHDSSLIYLYRLIFVLYAEAEGRDLLDTDNEIYRQSYSLNSLKQEVAKELDSGDPKYRNWQDNLSSRLDELFKLIDKGSESRGIPKDDLYIPAYNGGLFRTDPDTGDSPEAQFLANHRIGDEYLAKVIELLTRSTNDNDTGKIFVDYSSLDVRHLGSVYEGLLEYQLNIADEDLILEDGEYISASEDDEPEIETGDVYLTTDSGTRKATGSYYTPEYVVEYIVKNTLEPVIDEIYQDLLARDPWSKDGKGQFAEDFAERIFDLKILDPAMGSGHFLTNTVDYLARKIIEAQQRQADQEDLDSINPKHDIYWAKRQVAQRCIYGVDINSLAVELSKVSLWLRTLAAEQPLAFLDHHLKTGNSLVGTDIEEIDKLSSDTDDNDGNTTLADFGIARKGTIEQLMRIYQEFIAIENQNLSDVKEMESKYDEFKRNKLRNRLESIANVYTADQYGLKNIPKDAYTQMASALESDEKWENIQASSWYQNSQQWAKEDQYFHWKIEFPEVYYEKGGEESSNSGFDVIIGNPPYASISGDLKDYLENYLNGTKKNWDSYTAFVESSTKLLKNDGYLGFIIPNTFLIGPWYEDFRQRMIDLSGKIDVLSFGGEKIFPDATVFTSIWISTRSDKTCDVSVAMEEDLNQNIPEDTYWYTLDEDEKPELWIFKGDIVRKIEDGNLKLSDVCESYDSGMDYNRASVSDKVFYTGKKQNNADKKWLKGGDIERYYYNFEDRYVRHDWDSRLEKGEYLKVNTDAYNKCPKILTRQTGDEIISVVDEEKMYNQKSLHSTNLKQDWEDDASTKAISCILNSAISTYVYREYSRNEQGKALAQIKIDRLKRIPLPERLVNSTELIDKYDKINTLKSQMYNEVESFLSWISKEWGVNIDDLSLKTKLREYWKYEFDETLRTAKSNKNSICGDPSSREFQDNLQEEWNKSMSKIDPIINQISEIENDIEAQICSAYELNEDEIKTILNTVGTSDQDQIDIIRKTKSY